MDLFEALNDCTEHLKRIKEDSKGFTTLDAVCNAFPMASPYTQEVIAGWYENEAAIEEFDSLEDFANHIVRDIENMLECEADEEIVQDLVDAGYIDDYWLDQF